METIANHNQLSTRFNIAMLTILMALWQLPTIGNSALIVLDFEGLSDLEPVEEFYNGGAGGFGSGPGPDFGISISSNALAVTDMDAGGSGDFGGEPSGSWVFPKNLLCPDGIYAAARLVAIAGAQKLSQLVDSVPRYPLLRGSVDSEGISVADLKRQLLAMKPLSVNNIDGIKLNFKDGWLLIRASGTEPKIRITAEAKSETRAHQLYDGGVRAIKDCLKAGEED